MDIEDTPQQTSQTESQPPRGTGNRYVLIAVLAVVVVVTVMLLRQNMEPPPQQQTQQSAGGEEQMDPMAQMEQVEQQLAHVKEILAADSTNFDAWAALGNLYYDANMPDEAIHHYEKALEIKPDDLHVQTDLATMLRAKGDSERAVTILDKVVTEQPDFGQAWFNMGVIYTFDLKDPAKAVQAWERYLELEPNSQHAEAIRKELDRMRAEM